MASCRYYYYYLDNKEVQCLASVVPLVEQILHTGNVSCERVISRVHAGRRHVLSLWHGPSPPPPREIWADKDVAPVVIEGGDSSHEDHKTESGSHLSPESWNQQFPGSLIRSAHGRHFQYQPSDYSPKAGGRGERGLLLRGEEGNKEEEGRWVSFFFFFLEKEFECFASFSCVADVGTSCYLFRKG